MIIKSAAIPAKSTEVKRTLLHVFKGEENEVIRSVPSYEHDIYSANEILSDVLAQAVARGRANALLHFKVSPAKDMSADFFAGVQERLASELGIRPEFVIGQLHRKKRSSGSSTLHAHFYVPVHHPVTGRHLDLSHLKRRQERLARELEVEVGERLTKGRHNLAVANALKKRGDPSSMRVVAAMQQEGLLDEGPSLAAYSDRRFQTAKRARIDLPSLRRELVDAYSRSGPPGVAGVLRRRDLKPALGQQAGSVVILTAQGRVIGELTRMLVGGVKNARRAVLRQRRQQKDRHECISCTSKQSDNSNDLSIGGRAGPGLSYEAGRRHLGFPALTSQRHAELRPYRPAGGCQVPRYPVKTHEPETVATLLTR